MKFLSKPNISRILYKNFHNRESNDFSKSISIKRADCLFMACDFGTGLVLIILVKHDYFFLSEI